MDDRGKRHYIALAKDPARKDTIVFSVMADSAAQARALVEQFYLEQQWDIEGLSIQTKLLRHSDNKPVQFIGHALEAYQDLESDLRAAYHKLLDEAEGEAVLSHADALRAFVQQSEIGQQVYHERYGNS